jgi:hypothetical protein
MTRQTEQHRETLPELRRQEGGGATDCAYHCPPGAGPAWRAAHEFGFDMSLVEEALRKTPEQRLDDHQGVLDLILEIEAARQENPDAPE